MQTRTLTEQLVSVRAERDSLLQQKDVGSLESTEELLSQVASVSQDRDQLQGALEALREEKQQLQAKLDDRMEAVCVTVLQQPTFGQNSSRLRKLTSL